MTPAAGMVHEMATMTLPKFPKANALLEIETRDAEPEAGWVLLKVGARGVCHSVLFVQGGSSRG